MNSSLTRTISRKSMKTLSFENREAWLEARQGRITGSKDIVVKRGTGKKMGFYEIIAERIGLPADEEAPMERGSRLEVEAIEKFCEETGKEVDTSLVMWVRDEDESIAISPDGFIGTTEAVEVKCLSSARHIQAWHTKSIPSDYEYQKLQYFAVNDDLKKLHFVFYDPRIPSIGFFVIEVNREDVQDEVDAYLEYQRRELKEINEIVNQLTF